jgi:hypothetical protein
VDETEAREIYETLLYALGVAHSEGAIRTAEADAAQAWLDATFSQKSEPVTAPYEPSEAEAELRASLTQSPPSHVAVFVR